MQTRNRQLVARRVDREIDRARAALKEGKGLRALECAVFAQGVLEAAVLLDPGFPPVDDLAQECETLAMRGALAHDEQRARNLQRAMNTLLDVIRARKEGNA